MNGPWSSFQPTPDANPKPWEAYGGTTSQDAPEEPFGTRFSRGFNKYVGEAGDAASALLDKATIGTLALPSELAHVTGLTKRPDTMLDENGHTVPYNEEEAQRIALKRIGSNVGEAITDVARPVADALRVPQQAREIGGNLAENAGQLVTSPGNLAIAAATGGAGAVEPLAAKALGRGIATVFGSKMATDLPSLWNKVATTDPGSPEQNKAIADYLTAAAGGPALLAGARSSAGEPTLRDTSPPPPNLDPAVEALAAAGGNPLRRLGLPLTPSPFGDRMGVAPEVPALVDQSLKEAQNPTLIPGQEPALQTLRRALNPPAIEQAGNVPKEDVAGGQISFAAPAEAEAVPSARQAAVPERTVPDANPIESPVENVRGETPRPAEEVAGGKPGEVQPVAGAQEGQTAAPTGSEVAPLEPRPGEKPIIIRSTDEKGNVTEIKGSTNGKVWEVPGQEPRPNVARPVEVSPGQFMWSDGPLRPNETVVDVAAPKADTETIIQKLQSLKYETDSRGRILNPEGKTFSVPHPDAIKMIGKTAWNDALDLAIGAVRAGKAVKEALDIAIGHIKRTVKSFDEDKIRANLGSYLEKETPAKTDQQKPVPAGSAVQSANPVQPASDAAAGASAQAQPGNPISKFAKSDVVPAVSRAISGVRQAGADIQAALTPPNVSAISKVTAGNMRENLADLARKTETAAREFQKAKNAFDRADDQSNLDFIKRMEAGREQPTPELQAISTRLRKAFDDRVEQVRALGNGKLEQVIQDYFPHIWTQESVDALHNVETRPDNVWARMFGKRPLEGSKSFLKQRTFPTTEEGINAGLVPVTYNPVELALLKMREMDKYVAGQKIFQEMKDNGTAQLVKFEDRPPNGWTRINDKIAQAGSAGHYFAPDAAARVINNYLSPGLRGNVIFDAARGTGNVLNQAQLGLSAYHLTFTAIDSATSALALGIKKAVESGGNPGELGSAALSAAKAVIPLYAQLENFIKASPFLKEYYKPGAVGGQIAGLVDAFQAAGGRVKMDSFYRNSSIENFWKAIKDGNYPGALLRAPWAALHAVSKPIMEVLVPRMKIGIFMDMAQHELSKMTDAQKLDRDYVRKTLGDAWDSVDNRMGQMVYDNLFWNKVLKDLSMVSVRSVGWNLGTLREIGGGVSDATLGAAKSIVKGRDIGNGNLTRLPQFTHRMGYVVALPVLVGLYGAMYQYARTGKGPENLEDYYVPKTGNKTADGNDERVMLPTYMKDISPLAVATQHSGIGGGVARFTQMVQNKSNPVISMISQMLHNKDFYGTQIRNVDDPIVKQAMDEAKFIGANFQPFSIRNTKQRVGDTAETKVEGVLGILPAAKELMRSKAQQMMSEMMQSKAQEGGTTQEVAARKQALRDIATASNSREDAAVKIVDLMKAGKLSENQALDAIRNQYLPTDIRMFKRLSVDEALKVYDAATPTEKAAFKSHLMDKIGNAYNSGNWPVGKPIPKAVNDNVVPTN